MNMIAIMSGPLSFLFSTLSSVERTYDCGTFLFRRDDRVRNLFVVRSGSVCLVRHQKTGTRLILQRAGPDTVLAEASVFSDRYHCDGEAVLKTQVAVFDRNSLRAALAEKPDIAEAWMVHLSRNLQAARSRAELLTLRTVSERLDAWLDDQGGRLPEKGTWHGIAAQIGTSPEALYRELARRRRDGKTAFGKVLPDASG